MTEVVDERTPLGRINVVLAGDEVFASVDTHDPDLDRSEADGVMLARIGKMMNLFELGLELNRTVHYPRWLNALRRLGRQAKIGTPINL
jgi:hypothetical protein